MGSSFSDMGGGIGPADAFNERLDKMTKLLAHQIRIRNTLSFTMMEQTKVEREAIRVAVEDAAVQLDVADSLDDVADALGAVTKARELETRAANAELQAWSAQMRELDNYNAHMNQAAASSRQRTTAAQNASNSGGGGYGGGYSGSGYSGRYPESNIPHGFEALGMLQQAQAAGGDNSGKETAKAAGLITSGMAIGFGIGTAIGGPPGGIIGYGVGAAAGVVAALFESARDVVGAIADAVWPFAAGGVVTSPTLGLVAENGPEAVIPLDQLSGIMAGGGGSDVHVHLELDGRELTSAVLQNLGGELTRRRI